jgi:diguanylate cyclase (GGDEF)-like protein
MTSATGSHNEGAFVRLLLDLVDAADEPGRAGPDRVLGDLSRLLDADLLYTVLPAEEGWIKRGYSAEGTRGSSPIERPAGIVRHVLSRRSRFLETHPSPRGPFLRHQDGWPGLSTGSFVAVPVHRRGRLRGVLVLLRAEGRPPFEPSEIPRVEMLAETIALCAGQEERLRALEQLSRTDGLTHLPNYRWARELLQREILRAQRQAQPLAVIRVEIQDWKELCLRKGNLPASELLRRFGRVLERNLRGSDAVAHLGGDAFLLVLPETGREGAERAAARVEAALAQEFAEETLPVRARKGIACYPDDGADLAGLLDTGTRQLAEDEAA